jgi:hypothetical protein
MKLKTRELREFPLYGFMPLNDDEKETIKVNLPADSTWSGLLS